MKIDGKTTDGVTLDVAQTMIRGEAGTPVVLTIERDKEVKDFTVVRGKILSCSSDNNFLCWVFKPRE